ncbi:endonuclease V [Candidatus Woesearchaeota archaeon]|nr:endonuclease V [Candidatus Woesearchaeota archaeon]
MIDFDKLREEQTRLSKSVIIADRFRKVETIAGIDQSYMGNDIISCIVVCNAKTLEVIETQSATVPSMIPYKPGFLAYREMPAMIEAFGKLENSPDIILVDGHGITHPRKMGIATHVGLVLGRPTIGIAQSLITGNIENGKIFIDNELRGFEVRTKEHARVLYVSPGHMVSLGASLKIVQDCLRHPHKLPEPLHLAHKAARRELKERREVKAVN